MKKSLLLFVVAGSLAVPAVAHANTPTAKSKTAQSVTITAPPKDKMVYYIGTEAATGSHIPTVRRAYNGRIDTASSPAIYGLRQIQQTGQLDLGAALLRLDPSISLR